MAIIKNIGKNTLGDNNKMSVRLHEYEMSTHNLSYVWRNTQSPGTLVPFMKIPAQKGDTFDIDLTSKIMTHPTVGPCFGSYKMQYFVFSCPIRLYNSWLHNNRNGIGLKMSQIKMPIVRFNSYSQDESDPSHLKNNLITNPSSLYAYLGYRGKKSVSTSYGYSQNALPILMYWDIFKNYFANKQETNAYYINKSSAEQIITVYTGGQPNNIPINSSTSIAMTAGSSLEIMEYNPNAKPNEWRRFWESVTLTITKSKGGIVTVKIPEISTAWNTKSITINTAKWNEAVEAGTTVTLTNLKASKEEANQVFRGLTLKSFPLENIDKARDTILGTAGNTTLNINNLPEPLNIAGLRETINGEVVYYKSLKQYGLAIKTYDSDLLQNWINTEWIEGANGINEITSVDVSDGSLSLDSLNLAKKVYNMLNRIAVSGGTYRDWLETTYTAGNYLERPETPVFEGGMTQWIEFEEVVSKSATEDQPLGDLAGRGRITKQQGSGKIHIKIHEPSYLMGICAITPQIDYSQGEDWDINEIFTMDDWHKPALDGIGYEDSLNYMRAFWDDTVTAENTIEKKAIGKTVAWINYMTNINRTYGNFASGQPESFMCLNRNYEGESKGEITDNTTYIDPRKHNEIFADTEINAMNFWVQVGVNMTKRGNISAKQIPTM